MLSYISSFFRKSKSFWLDKTSGEKCIMLSPKGMVISWVNSPQFWRWTSISEARFEEVPELLYDCLFEVCGRLSTKYLSPRTRYSVYIVFKTNDLYPGVTLEPFPRFVRYVGPTDLKYEREYVTRPEKREDKWMEAELGEFFNETSCGDVEVSVIDENSYWKSGLVIQGIEFRPTKKHVN
ncbi:putative phloem protein [Arabidopsis thaliana]